MFMFTMVFCRRISTKQFSKYDMDTIGENGRLDGDRISFATKVLAMKEIKKNF